MTNAAAEKNGYVMTGETIAAGAVAQGSALKRSDAQHFRSELSRARLFLSRMGKHAFRRTQSDAAVPVGGAVSGACDLYGHYII